MTDPMIGYFTFIGESRRFPINSGLALAVSNLFRRAFLALLKPPASLRPERLRGQAT